MFLFEEEQHQIYLTGLCHVNHFLHHIICILVLRNRYNMIKKPNVANKKQTFIMMWSGDAGLSLFTVHT